MNTEWGEEDFFSLIFCYPYLDLDAVQVPREVTMHLCRFAGDLQACTGRYLYLYLYLYLYRLLCTCAGSLRYLYIPVQVPCIRTCTYLYRYPVPVQVPD